jgi:hypothetical protein
VRFGDHFCLMITFAHAAQIATTAPSPLAQVLSIVSATGCTRSGTMLRNKRLGGIYVTTNRLTIESV